MSVHAIIPARGGSKGVPGKNIKPLGGFPLIAYAICASMLSKNIGRTIVSTDSEDIANVAKRYGAEVPFLRPAEIAQDDSPDLDLFQHAIRWFRNTEGKVPELLVHLRPTTPLRIPSEIDRAIHIIRSRPDSTSLRSVHKLAEPPQKVFQIGEDGFLQGFFPDDPRPEYYNLPRQSFPQAYHPNGYVDIVKTDFVENNHVLHGPMMLGMITSTATEVDLPEDFDILEFQLARHRHPIYQYLSDKFSKENHVRI